MMVSIMVGGAITVALTVSTLVKSGLQANSHLMRSEIEAPSETDGYFIPFR